MDLDEAFEIISEKVGPAFSVEQPKGFIYVDANDIEKNVVCITQDTDLDQAVNVLLRYAPQEGLRIINAPTMMDSQHTKAKLGRYEIETVRYFVPGTDNEILELIVYVTRKWTTVTDPQPPSRVDTLAQVLEELANARAKWGPFSSAHEGYAILLEEVRELERHVFTNQKRRDLAEMRAEAIQVAAMAVRFAEEVCSEERGRK